MGRAFVRKVDDTELTQVIHVVASQTRPGSFSLAIGLTAPAVVYLWTGTRERNAALATDFLEVYRGHELTGDQRHREFHAEDPDVGLALSRAAEKITVALRRETFRTWTALLKRTKSVSRHAAILHFVGREAEARQMLEREMASVIAAGGTDAADRETRLRAQLRRFEQPYPSSKRRPSPFPR